MALQQQQTQRDPMEKPSRPGATGTTAAGTAPDDPAVAASMSKGPATPEGTQVLRLFSASVVHLWAAVLVSDQGLGEDARHGNLVAAATNLLASDSHTSQFFSYWSGTHVGGL